MPSRIMNESSGISCAAAVLRSTQPTTKRSIPDFRSGPSPKSTRARLIDRFRSPLPDAVAGSARRTDRKAVATGVPSPSKLGM